MRSPLWPRVALCALALGGGAAIERATASSPSVASAAAARSLRSASATRALDAAVAPEASMASISLGSTPSHPFGEAYRDGLLITGSTPHRLLLFTFDDGPHKSTTPVLLDKLDRVGIKAVFFLSTHRIRGINRTEREQAEVARDTIRRGHIVANHTMFHVALPTLETPELLDEIENSERVFAEVLGARPWLFRPPYGVHTERTDRLLAERGYTIMLWNVGTGDPQVRTAAEVLTTFKNVLEYRERDLGERGGVVLMHDTHEWSVEAFDLIVAEIQRRNCELLETDEELYDIVDDPRFFFVPREPRDDRSFSTSAPPARLAPEVLAERQAHLRRIESARCEGLDQRPRSRL